MKIAMNTWCFPDDIGLPAILDAVQEAGFQGVELNMTDDGYLTPYSGPNDYANLKQMCNTRNLTLHAMASNIFFITPLTLDGEEGELVMNKAKMYIYAAASMGVDTVLLTPGAVNENISYIQAYERAGNNITE